MFLTKTKLASFRGALDWYYFKSKYEFSRKWRRSGINSIENIILDGGISNKRKKSGSAGWSYHDQGERIVKLYNKLYSFLSNAGKPTPPRTGQHLLQGKTRNQKKKIKKR
mgnify:CR=1 FL=1